MNLSIRSKLLLLFFALALAPLVGVGLVSYHNSVRSVQAVVEGRTAEAAERIAADMRAFVSPRRAEVGLLARNREVRDFYALRAEVGGEAALERMRPRLEAFFRQFFTGPRQGFAQVRYLDAEGKLLFRYARSSGAADPALAMETYALSTSDPAFAGAILPPPGAVGVHMATAYEAAFGPVLRLGAPVAGSDGLRAGYVLADLGVDAVVQKAAAAQQLPSGDQFLLFEGEGGRLLAHPQRALVGQELALVLPGLAAALSRSGDSALAAARYRSGGEEYLASVARVEEPGWNVAVLARPSPFMASARRAGLLNLVVTGAAALLALVLVPLVVGRIAASVRRLKEGAEAIAAGDLEQRIEVDTRDETHALAGAFNRMALSLRRSLEDLRRLNEELEARVQQRTAELEGANQRLEAQNRELEVERALEHVRAAVAGMEQSGDLEKVRDVIVGALRGLGVRLDAVGINIIDSKAMSVQFMDGFTYPVDEAEKAEKAENRTAFDELYRRWKRGETWVRHASREKLESMSRALAAAGHISEEKLRVFAESLRDRWIVDVPFARGTLAMNRHGPESDAFGEEEVRLLERFAEVFALAYARFLDLEAAERRSHQLGVERAVERVRAEALSMRTSEDIGKVVVVMWREMVALGIDTPAASIIFIDEQADAYTHYQAGIDLRQYGLEFYPEQVEGYTKVDIDEETALIRVEGTLSHRRALHQGESVISGWRDQRVVSYKSVMSSKWFGIFGFKGDAHLFDASPLAGEWTVTNVPFAYGLVGFREKAFSEEHVAVVRQLAEALSLGYLRFLDFQRLEEQNRAVGIERALERVRGEIMGMKGTQDAQKAVNVLGEELRALGVAFDQLGINILDEQTGATLAQWNLVPGVSVSAPAGAGRQPGAAPDPDSSAGQLVDHWRRGAVWHRQHERQWVLDTVSSWNRERGADLDPGAEVWVADVPFPQGTLAVNRGWQSASGEPFGEEELEILQRFAEVVSLGYARFLDFQRLEEQNRALEEANARIQEANRLKSEFLANMSHELRTPMNAIVGFSRIVHRRSRDLLPPRQIENLEKVLQSSEILMSLINDILDLSKIEAGRLEIAPEPFSLRELAESCLGTVSPMVKSGVETRAECAPQIDQIYSDPARVRQILINLLSNAAKFTESGSITVFLRPAGEELVEMAVQDTGIGIPSHAREYIFEEFRQVDGTTTRKYGGTGLGLSITRKLAGMLGGEIRLESEVGRGSTFTVSLPARYSPPAERVEGAAEGEHPRAAGRRLVLCIDDDPNVLSLIAQELEEEGFEVVGATRALEGIEKAKELSPCAITLDIMMPGMDGWEAIGRLKGDPATRDIPLIVVSIIDNRELGFRLGADEYLVKPVDRDSLMKVLGRFRSQGRQILVADDDPAVVDLVRQLLEEGGWTVRGAANGQQALETIAAGRPDVLFLDLMMPVMDGFETLKRLRDEEATRDLPVVIVTARDLSPEERQELGRNAARIVEKDGLDRQHLLREMRAALKGAGK